MYYIDLTVAGQTLTVPSELLIVNGTKGLITCRFTFTNWNDFTTKTAVFKNSNTSIEEDVAIINNMCVVPSSVLKYKGIINMAVRGENSSQIQRTESKAIIKQLETLQGGIEGDNIPQSQYSKYIDALAAETAKVTGMTVSSHSLTPGTPPTVTKTVGVDEKVNLDFGIPDAALGGVTSVNGKTGNVTLNYSDVGADVSGSAAAVEADIEDGTIIAGKATSDANGNIITVTYGTKTEVNSKYTKPNTGIPKTDLTTSVQASLNLADSAVQDVSGKVNYTDKLSQITGSMNSTEKANVRTAIGAGIGDGTITKVQINGVDIASSGAANIPPATTSNYGVTQLVADVTSTETNKALAANQGKALNDRIDSLATIGRFLSIWDATTGLPTSDPTSSPYTYHTGDYFRIANVNSTAASNLIPNGNSYTRGVASTTHYVPTTLKPNLEVGDIYYFDSTQWVLEPSGGQGLVQDVQVDGTSIVSGGIADVTLGAFNVSANSSEINILDGATLTTSELNILDGITSTTQELNYVDGVTSNIQTQLDSKEASANKVSSWQTIPDNTHYPSEKLVKDSLDTKANISTTYTKTQVDTLVNNAKEIFEVTYETTTFAEISAAFASGKLPVLKIELDMGSQETFSLPLFLCSENEIIFSNIHGVGWTDYSSLEAICINVTSDDQWSDIADSSVSVFQTAFTSELTNDGEDGENPFITAEALADYSTTSEMNTAINNHHDSTKQDTSNLVTSVSSASTDSQYPSAKCLYDMCGNIESLLAALR